MALRLAVVDNYDSFSHNVVHALTLAGGSCELFANDHVTAAELLNEPYAGFVISAGPCTPQSAGISLELIERHVRAADPRPLLGLCLGHQAIATVVGGRLRRARRPLHGERCAIYHDGGELFTGMPDPFQAARYNSLSVAREGLSDKLRICAWDAEQEVMALEHRSAPLWGVQFHPESAISAHGARLFGNWLALVEQAAAAACGSDGSRAGSRA